MSASEEYKRLTQNVMPQTEHIYSQLINLYQNEQRDFDGMHQKIDEVLASLRTKINESNNNINELIKKNARDKMVMNKGQTFLQSKADEIKNKNKIIESIVSGLKEAVSKIKPKDLSELPVEKERSLQETFKVLFKVLYGEKEENFLWKDFKKKALEDEGGEDFQSRLANINIRNIPEEDYKKIMERKEDPEFNKLCENPKYSMHLIDLADWMEHVCAGYDFHTEKEDVGKAYNKIETDIRRRIQESKQADESLHFWKETLAQSEDFQNNLANIEARLKTIKIGIEQAIPRLENSVNESKEKFTKLPKPF